jgi:pimeloyl-ACP methyl ester carboxylesterase
MKRVRSGDAEIAYEVLGDGPPVVLLHPFPTNHEWWQPAAQNLLQRYRVILPDLRGHGESEVGEGPATMDKHAADLARVLDDAEVGRAVMAGVSIGGYLLFEFWRRFRGRVAGLALIDTKATADKPDAYKARLATASDVIERGTEPFIEGMLLKVFGETTRRSRPDLLETARHMMLKMSAEDVSLVQRGMAERPDSVATLKTINVPTLILTGDEDTLTPVADAEVMRQNISGSELKVIPKAGHFAAYEQSELVGKLLRQFLDAIHGG